MQPGQEAQRAAQSATVHGKFAAPEAEMRTQPQHQSEGDDSRSILMRAREAYAAGNFKDSESFFRALIARGQNVAEGFYGAGACRLSADDLDTASQLLENAARLDSSNGNAYYLLGEIAARRGAGEQARSYYNRALAVNPLHQGARKKLEEAGPPIRSSTTGRATPESSANGNGTGTGASPAESAIHENANDPLSGSQPYGQYGFLLNDSFATSKEILALMDSTRLSRRPSLTAWLGATSLKGLLFWSACFALPDLLWALVPAYHVASNHGQVPNPGVLQGWILLVVAAVVTISLIRWTSFEYTIDKGRLQIRGGVLLKRTWNIELYRIFDIRLERSLINQMTGDGTLVFELRTSTKTFYTRVPGLAKATELETLRVQLLNLVGLLRTHPYIKGIIN